MRLPGRFFQSERYHGKELKHQRWIVDDHQMLLVCSNWHREISKHFPLMKLRLKLWKERENLGVTRQLIFVLGSDR